MAKDVKVQIVGDASKYKAALADAGSASDKFANKTKNNADQMSKFGLGALAVAGAVGVGLFKAGEAASNLGESINAVKVTFGPAASGILKLGEDAAKSVGLSNTAFNGLAVQFSAFADTIAGKGGNVVGTIQEMTGRAADFASVMNIDVAEAARLFQSGLAGETEPLKKFGIDLSAAAVTAYAAANGIGEVGKQLTESEKVTARYGLLMEKTSKTQGDFANTADSAANATRIAKAEFENAAASLGAAVAPIIATVAGTVADLASGLVGLNKASGGAVVAFGGVAVAGIGLVGIVTSVIARVQKMREVLVAADGSLTGAGKAAKGLSIALGIAALAMFAHGQAVKNAQERQDEFTDSISELGRVADEEFGKAFFQTLGDGFAQVALDGKSASDMFDEIAHGQIEGARRALEWAKANGVAQVTIDGLTTAIAKEEAAVKQGAKTTEEFGETVEELAPPIDHAAHGIEMLNQQMESQSKRATEAAKAAEDLAQETLDLAAAQVEAVGTSGDFEQSIRDLESSYYDLQLQIEANTEAQKDSKLTDEAKAQSARDVASAVHENAVEVFELSQKYAAEKGAVEGSKEQHQLMRDSLELSRQKYPELRDELNRYIAMLNLAAAAAGNLGAAATGLGGTKYGAPGYAVGDDSFASGTARVPGALGQPMMAVVHGGEQITSAGGNGSGGPITVNVIMPVGSDGDDVIRAIKKWENRNGPGWRQ